MDFEEVYNACYMRVYSYVMTLAKSRALAEEITQHTFYKAMLHRAELRSDTAALTWLCSIAKNLFYDELRRQRRLTELPPDDTLQAEENPEQTVSDADTAYHIHVILHNLDEPYKEVFQLRVFGRLSFQKIAMIFGKTENWARVTYHRARLKIQERMNADE